MQWPSLVSTHQSGSSLPWEPCLLGEWQQHIRMQVDQPYGVQLAAKEFTRLVGELKFHSYTITLMLNHYD